MEYTAVEYTAVECTAVEYTAVECRAPPTPPPHPHPEPWSPEQFLLAIGIPLEGAGLMTSSLTGYT